MSQQQQHLPSHVGTKISQANKAIEEQLMKELNQVVNLIRKRLGKVDNVSKINDFYQIRRIITPDVYDILREAATQSYELGIDYTTKQILKKPGYITESDIQEIKNMTNYVSGRFWARTQQAIFGTSDRIHKLNEQELPSNPVNQNYIVNAIAIDLTSSALNRAVVIKGRKLAQ